MRLRDRRFLILAASILLIAVFAGQPVFYYMAYFFFLLNIAAYLVLRKSLLKLVITADPTRVETTAGEEVALQLRFYNEALVPISSLTMDEHQLAKKSIELRSGPVHYSIAPFGVGIGKYTVCFPRRGLYQLRETDFTLREPFGIFEANRKIDKDIEIKVYPRTVNIDSLLIPALMPFGRLRTKERALIDPSHLADVRKFQTGDSFKKVHWKVTAHRGELFVKEFELTATSELHIFLDMCQNSYRDALKVSSGKQTIYDLADVAVETAASVAKFTTGRNLPTAFYVNSKQPELLPPSAGERQFRKIMELLLTVRVNGELPAADFLRYESLRIPPRSTIIIISADRTSSFTSEVSRLVYRGAGVMLFSVTPKPSNAENEAQQRERIVRSNIYVEQLRERGVSVWQLNRVRDLLKGSGGATA